MLVYMARVTESAAGCGTISRTSAAAEAEGERGRKGHQEGDRVERGDKASRKDVVLQRAAGHADEGRFAAGEVIGTRRDAHARRAEGDRTGRAAFDESLREQGRVKSGKWRTADLQIDQQQPLVNGATILHAERAIKIGDTEGEKHTARVPRWRLVIHELDAERG